MQCSASPSIHCEDCTRGKQKLFFVSFFLSFSVSISVYYSVNDSILSTCTYMYMYLRFQGCALQISLYNSCQPSQIFQEARLFGSCPSLCPTWNLQNLLKSIENSYCCYLMKGWQLCNTYIHTVYTNLQLLCLTRHRQPSFQR